MAVVEGGVVEFRGAEEAGPEAVFRGIEGGAGGEGMNIRCANVDGERIEGRKAEIELDRFGNEVDCGRFRNSESCSEGRQMEEDWN